MAEQANNSKPLKWAYPFQAKDDSTTKGRKTVEDSKSYFEALALASDGFYPVGSNGLWHGGIHFSSETGAKLDQEQGVRAIADGEVVAYRIDSAYPNVNYDCGSATYSTGFVLIKHKLKLPKVPEKTTDSSSKKTTNEPSDSKAASPATTTSTDEPALVFYSLYMHLLDWSHYQANRKLSRPKFWDNEFVVTDKSKDREEQLAPGQVGIRVRNADNQPIAILPRGTQVKLGDEGKHKGYFSIASVTSGAAIPAISDGYVYKKELGAAGSPSSKGAVVFLSKPVPVAAGELVGHLGQYARFTDAGPLACTDRPLMHLEVFSTDDVKGFVEKSRARDKQLNADAKTLLVVPKGARLVLPLKHDTSIAACEDVLVASDSPKQGEWAKVHKTSAVQTSSAPASALWVERKMLSSGGNRASTNDSLVAWTRFPLQASNATGPSTSFERVASIQSLTPMATDDQGVRWWQIDVDTPDAKGNVLGWICETGNLQSPWAWPGFEFIEEQTSPTDLHGKQIIDQRLDTHADSADFKAKAAKAKASPLFQKLYNILYLLAPPVIQSGIKAVAKRGKEGAPVGRNQQSGPAAQSDLKVMAERTQEGPQFQKLYDTIDTDNKSGLTTEELRAALRKPWLAQAISHLIVRYESEWGGEMSKWDALDPHMGESINDWQKEKERIKRLQWWKNVPGLGGPEAYHFHPVGLVSCFNIKISGRVTAEMLRKIFPKAPDERINLVVEGVNLNIETGKIDSEERITHFFGQVLQEVGAQMSFRENLRYNSRQLFEGKLKYYTGNRVRSDRDALNEEAIANNAYDDRNRSPGYKLGNTQPGDGWRYRGRGLKQLTGRDNYRGFTSKHQEIWGEFIDFEANPDKLDEPIYAVRSSLYFWIKNKLYLRADKGITEEVTNSITDIINKGTDSYNSRWKNVENIWKNHVFEDAFK